MGDFEVEFGNIVFDDSFGSFEEEVEENDFEIYATEE